MPSSRAKRSAARAERSCALRSRFFFARDTHRTLSRERKGGGGAITRLENVERVRRKGVLVCLEADIDTIFARVDRRDDRPLLAGLAPEEKRAKIERMLEERAPFYDQADIKLRTREEQTPQDTAQQLIKLLEHWHAPN